MILALDTTSEFGSIALVEEHRTVEEIQVHSPDGFGHVLFEHVAALLQRHNIVADDIDCFAAASGPGSFTGVRVGLTAVKGLAEATGKKVVPVSNLQALAFFGTASLRAVVLDARRGEVYAAVYDSNLEPVIPESVGKYDEWLEHIPKGDIEFITAKPALAGAIGQIAWRKWKLGEALDPAAIDANYVRRSDAELLWKPPS